MAMKIVRTALASTGSDLKNYPRLTVDVTRVGLFYFDQPSILAHLVRN
jgi:hypothetical protein